MDEFEHVVSGRRMTITLFDFKLRACRHLEDEQAKANPDNALIALLCEGVRLARESEDSLRQPLPSHLCNDEDPYICKGGSPEENEPCMCACHGL